MVGSPKVPQQDQSLLEQQRLDRERAEQERQQSIQDSLAQETDARRRRLGGLSLLRSGSLSSKLGKG